MRQRPVPSPLHLLCLVLIFFVAMPCARAARTPIERFAVSAGASWENVQTLSDGAVFRNNRSSRNAVIVVRVVDFPSADHLKPNELVEIADAIEQMRNGVLSFAGFGPYKSHTFSLGSATAFGAKTIFTEAKYVGATGVDVSVVERDLFVGDSLYQITYSEESPAIVDLSQVQLWLDTFRPRPKKVALHDYLTQWLIETAAAVEAISSSPETPSSSTDQPRPPIALHPKAEDCAHLVPDETQRRKDSDPSLLTASGAWSVAKGCSGGVLDFGESFANSCLTMARNLLPGYAAYKNAKWIWQYETDPAFKAGTDAKAMIVAEAAKHPIETTDKVLRGIAEYAGSKIAAFPCLNIEAQTRIVCRTLSFAATTLTGAGLARLAARAGVAAEDGVKLMSFLDREVKVETRAAKTAEKIATEGTKDPKPLAPETKMLRADRAEVKRNLEKFLKTPSNAAEAAETKKLDEALRVDIGDSVAKLTPEKKARLLQLLGETKRTQPFRADGMNGMSYATHNEHGSVFFDAKTTPEMRMQMLSLDHPISRLTTRHEWSHLSRLDAGADLSAKDAMKYADSVMQRRLGIYREEIKAWGDQWETTRKVYKQSDLPRLKETFPPTSPADIAFLAKAKILSKVEGKTKLDMTKMDSVEKRDAILRYMRGEMNTSFIHHVEDAVENDKTTFVKKRVGQQGYRDQQKIYAEPKSDLEEFFGL